MQISTKERSTNSFETASVLPTLTQQPENRWFFLVNIARSIIGFGGRCRSHKTWKWLQVCKILALKKIPFLRFVQQKPSSLKSLSLENNASMRFKLIHSPWHFTELPRRRSKRSQAAYKSRKRSHLMPAPMKRDGCQTNFKAEDKCLLAWDSQHKKVRNIMLWMTHKTQSPFICFAAITSQIILCF